MKKILDYFSPNFMFKRSTRKMLCISILQFTIAILLCQYQGNEILPKPSGIFHEFCGIIISSDFHSNFISTLFFILKGMSISLGISLLICYFFKIDALRGLPEFTSELRFLTYTGIVFVFTVTFHDSGLIKLWVLVCGIVPYFVTSLLSYLNDIDPQEYQLCYTLKMNKWQIMGEVVVRGKLHLVIEVLKQNFAYAWMMITGVEVLYWAGGGLGTMLVTENKHFRMEKVFAILLIILITGFFFDYLFGVLKVYIFPYTDTTRYSRLWLVRLTSYFNRRKQFNSPVQIATK